MLEHVIREVAAARSGNARIVVLRGSRGVGKSSVLRRFIAIEKCRGSIVLNAAGNGDTCVLSVARRLLAPADVCVPDVDDASPGALFPLFLALSRRVVELSEDRQVCLVVDDLDACDPATVQWLEFLARRVADRPVALLLARGTDAVDPQVAEAVVGLVAMRCCSVVHLRTLHRPEVADRVRAALGTTPDRGLVDLCHQLSGGTPRHLEMLLAVLRPSAAGHCPLLNDLNRAAVTAVLGARLREKPHRIASAAAVVVLDSTDPELVGSLTGAAPLVAKNDIAVLRREHLLGHDLPGPVREWFDEAVLDVIGPERVNALRARAAAVLTNHGRPVEEVAGQLVLLDRIDLAWMAEALRETARLSSARGAQETAVSCLSRLVELEPDDAGLRLDLAAGLSRYDPAAAARRYRAVFRCAEDPVLRARAAIGLATVARDLMATGWLGEVLVAAHQALDEVPHRDPDGDLRALLTAACLSFELTRAGAAGSAAAKARAMTPPPGETAAQRCLLGVLAEAIMRGGGPVENALECARRAVLDVHAPPDRSAISAACVLRGAGEIAEALVVLDRAVPAFATVGDEPARCQALTPRAVIHMSIGDLPNAERDAGEAVRIVRARMSPRDVPRPMILLAWILLQRGENAEAERLLGCVDPAELADRVLEHREFLRASALLCHARQNDKRAARLAVQCRRAMREVGLRDPLAASIWADIAMLTAMAGHRLNPRAAADEAEELSRTWRTSEATAFAWLARGMVTAQADDVDRVSEASAAFAAVPAFVQKARAETLMGRHLLRRGDNSAARVRLRTAVGLALGCGHVPLVAEARELLQDAGGRMKIPAHRTVADVTRLTLSERKVVELAAKGASNREIARQLFVTVRTVEIHLTRAYRKLGVMRRADLSEVLAQWTPLRNCHLTAIE